MFGAEHAWVSPWVAGLPGAYIRDFAQVLRAWQPESYSLETETGRRFIQEQSFVRLSQAYDFFVPWVHETMRLDGHRVLEIGSGSGSSTAGLVLAGAEVLGLEINRKAAAVAQTRCEMLAPGCKATFAEITPDWLASDDAYDWDRIAHDFQPTIVVCYALLEHLKPNERIVLLYNAMRILPMGGSLIVFETPNRLVVNNWHGTQLLFSEILPDWMMRRYLTMGPGNGGAHARMDISEEREDETPLYRWGRGASFHEFLLAVGLECFEVVHDGYAQRILQAPNRRPVVDYEDALKRIFSAQTPQIPNGFARPSLDLILRKIAEPLRFDKA